MIEGWSAEPGALPAGWSGPALRRRLLEAHLAIDAPTAAAETLAEDIPSDLAGRDPRPSCEVSVKRTGRGAHEAPRNRSALTDRQIPHVPPPLIIGGGPAHAQGGPAGHADGAPCGGREGQAFFVSQKILSIWAM